MAKIIFSVLILSGLGLLIFTNNKKDEVNTDKDKSGQEVSQESKNEQTENIQSKDFTEKTTLTKLMEKGGSYICTFINNTQIEESTGTVYISGKKIRGDFISKVSIPGLPSMDDINTYMISDGESSYTWSSMSGEGYKVPIAEQDKTVTQSDTSVPTNQELDYKCVAWVADQSKFSLPTNITFKTI